MIGDAEVRQYREQGYIVVEGIYSPDEVAEMCGVLDELIAGARGLETHNAIYDLEPSHRPDQPRVRRIKEPFKAHPVYRRMAEHPRLLAMLTRLIGPDLRLHGGKINLKSAAYGAPVEWHQDWAFYPHTNDDVLAVGVMLDDMTPENGPLLVMPGSHKGPTWDHHADGCFAGAMDPAACPLDFAKAAMITGKAGACSFHHVRAIHGSAQNRSGADRNLLLYQVAAADAWDLRGLPSTWEESESRMIAGTPTLEPRVVPCPIRMPYPTAKKGGSIYENQSVVAHRYFDYEKEPA
jgi:phytanoyl-CoA hydroxylase